MLLHLPSFYLGTWVYPQKKLELVNKKSLLWANNLFASHTISSHHLIKGGNDCGKKKNIYRYMYIYIYVSVDETLEREKCLVLELEILPGRQLPAPVKRIHSCKTIKRFEKLPTIQW